MKISDIVRESRTKGSNGNSAKKLTIKLYGRGIVASSDRGGSEATNYFIRRAGQFAYSKLDCLNGAFGIIPPHLDGYQTTLDLPAFDFIGMVDPNWFLKTVARPSFYGRFKFAAIGSRKANRVPTDEFLATRLSIPPLPEQRAIAGVLAAVEEAIAKTEALILELKNSRIELTREFLGLEQAPKWIIRSVGSLLRQCQYGLSIPLDGAGIVPVLRMPDVDVGRINVDINKLKSTDVSSTEIAACAIRDGDILFNRTNSQALVGKTGIVRKLPSEPIVFASYLIRLSTNEDTNPFWLNAVLNLPRTQERLKTLATPGVSQWNINASTLKRFTLPVPPKGDQGRFAELYETIEDRLEAERDKLEAMDDVRVALAQELLSGRLRLPEDVIARHREKPDQAA
jgi:type I restriction enzyme S subunit